MSIEKDLRKDGIIILEPLDTLKINSIARSISTRICSEFPEFDINQKKLFTKICHLKMYYAKMEKGMAEANYCYKNSTIYFNEQVDKDNIEEYAVHECIHYLQEVKDNKNELLRMGLCDYTKMKPKGLAINEAAVQLLTSNLLKTDIEQVKYYGIYFSTESPSCYPLQCCLIKQMGYITGNNLLYKSTLFSNDEFKKDFSEKTSEKLYQLVEKSFDNLLHKEEEIIKLNNKIATINNRNKKVDHMINRISELKNEIMIAFMRTQNLILSSYFDKEFEKITELDQIELYREKLYKFRDCIGTADGYLFFDDYYLEKIAQLNHKANVIEYGGEETAINIRIEKKQNAFLLLLKKIKKLILREDRTEREY